MSITDRIVRIKRADILSIEAIIESSEIALKQIQNLIKSCLNHPPDFVVKEETELKIKLESFYKIHACITKYTATHEQISNRASSGNSSAGSDSYCGESSPPNCIFDESGFMKFPSNNYNNDDASLGLSNDRINRNDNSNFESLIFVLFYPDQMAVITAVKGVSISKLLEESMNNHKCTFEQHELIYNQTKQIIPWNTDSINLAMCSIVVIPSIYFHKYQSTGHSHNLKYVILPFKSLFCNICHKILTKGYKCKKCSSSFHTKCLRENKFNIMCKGFRTNSILSNVSDRAMSEVMNRNEPMMNSGNEMKNLTLQSLTPINNGHHLSTLLQLVDAIQSSVDKPIIVVEDTETEAYPLDSSNSPAISCEGDNSWRIDINNVIIGSIVGSGTYGTVYKAKWHGAVAIKFLKIKNPNVVELETFNNEVNVLRLCRHNNILLFMGCIYEPELGIVTQWCDGTTLYRHIHVYETDFDQKQICDFSRQIAEGMDYLHNRQIIHRDLKSNNIFIVDGYIIKIGDFGLATAKKAVAVMSFESGRQPTGSVLWMSPEILKMKESNPYSFKSDVYAYGIVLYEMLSYSLPYEHLTNIDAIIYLVGSGMLKPDYEEILSDNNKTLIDVYKNCIEYNPCLRPDFRQVVSIVSQAFHTVPLINRTTSCLNINSGSQLNVSTTSINMIKTLFFIPPYAPKLNNSLSHPEINGKL